MSQSTFKIAIGIIGIFFTLIFIFIVAPPAIESGEILKAFGAGFVNPFATGYSMDAICCGAILSFWIIYEWGKVKYAWICLILTFIPGVAVGLALYLILRTNQIESN